MRSPLNRENAKKIFNFQNFSQAGLGDLSLRGYIKLPKIVTKFLSYLEHSKLAGTVPCLHSESFPSLDFVPPLVLRRILRRI